MKPDTIKSNTFPFSRTSTLLRVSCVALLTSAALLANPLGHQKLALDGDPSSGSDEYSISSNTKILLSNSGIATFGDGTYGTRVFSGQPGSITEILAVGMAAPGNRRFKSIGYDHVINKNGNILFYATTELSSGGGQDQSGIYLRTNKTFRLIAYDLQSAPGGGSFSFSETPEGSLSNNGQFVAFRTETNAGPGEGIYLAELGVESVKIRRLAAIGMVSPAGGLFNELSEVYFGLEEVKVNNSGVVVFSASTTTTDSSLYIWDGFQLKLLVGVTDHVLTASVNDAGNLMVVEGYRGDYDAKILYGTIDQVSAVFKAGDLLPRGGDLTRMYNYTLSDSGFIGFTAQVDNLNDEAVVLWKPSGLNVIALASDAPPGGGLIYSIDDSFAMAGDKVYFKSYTSSGYSIFMGDGRSLSRVIGDGDTLEGQIVDDVSVSPTSGSENGQVVYFASLEEDAGLFIFPYVTAPEIAVQQPVGSNLTDGKSSKAFGSVKVGVTSKAKTFTIKNTGTANLKGLAITTNGINASEFKVSGLGATSLAPGKKTTFNVTFKPAKKGTRKAAIHIKSNDKDENPFDIKLTGEGVVK